MLNNIAITMAIFKSNKITLNSGEIKLFHTYTKTIESKQSSKKHTVRIRNLLKKPVINFPLLVF